MKKELMENFKPGDGTNEPIGKLTFGKDYEGVPMEWYILGADTGIGDGNNIAVFGMTPKNATVKVPKKSLKAYKKFLMKKGIHTKAEIK